MKKILKHAYRLIPFKHVFLRGLRKIWVPPRKVYQHLYFKGAFKVPVGKERFFRMKHYGYQLENDIFWSGIAGAWERNSLEIWMKLSSRAKVIFDIGANTGIYSLLAKSVNHSAEVYAFEPVKRVYRKLVDNCKMNGYDVHCYDKAVSNKEGTAVIYDSEMEHEYTASLIYK